MAFLCLKSEKSKYINLTEMHERNFQGEKSLPAFKKIWNKNLY